jgi:uncharacterized membrane protein
MKLNPKKNIVLGITLPYTKLHESEIKLIQDAYKRELGIAALLLALLPFITFFLPWTSINISILMNWTMLVIIVLFLVYTKYHKRLKAYKHLGHWEGPSSDAVKDVSKNLIVPVKPINRILFVLPAVLSFLPVMFDIRAMVIEPENGWRLISSGMFFVLTVSCILFYPIIYRQKAEIIDEDNQINHRLTSIRRYNWSKFWLWFEWMTGIFSILFWLIITGNITGTIGMIGIVVYTILVLWIAMKAEFDTRNAQNKLSEESTSPLYLDEDKYWMNGMFYYNQEDKHLMINQRVGMGTTINLARTSGKVIMLFSAVCLLLLPFTSIYIIREEFTPLKVEVVEDSIVVTHTSKVCTIPVEDISSASIIDTLPSRSKIIGTGMDNLLKGTFNMSGYGSSKVYLNPKESPFLVITTDNEDYFINGNTTIVEILEQQGKLDKE